MEQVDAVVIGAGVVGLAIARELAMAGREVLVLEAAGMIGTETSSRNSEVIHAGIYYPTGSLKARSCVAGKHLLYAYCAEHGVPHRRCGKLIVATSEAQRATLEQIRAKAAANGVDDLRWLERAALRDLEPEVEGVAALLSPSTGIIDSHGLMLAYQGDAEDHGAMIAFHAPVTGGRAVEDGIELAVGGDDPMGLCARSVVNSAGLHAPAVARTIEGLAPELIPPAYLCKGNYYTCPARGRSRIWSIRCRRRRGSASTSRSTSPARCASVPTSSGSRRIDYDVDPARAAGFYQAIRQYYPGLKDGAIEPGYAGIRPKIAPKGTQAADFVIQGPREHGVPGLVNLFAIESPGLTSSLVLAQEVGGALGHAVSRAA